MSKSPHDFSIVSNEQKRVQWRKKKKWKKDVFISAQMQLFYSDATKEISNCRTSLCEDWSHPGKSQTIKQRRFKNILPSFILQTWLMVKKVQSWKKSRREGLMVWPPFEGGGRRLHSFTLVGKWELQSIVVNQTMSHTLVPQCKSNYSELSILKITALYQVEGGSLNHNLAVLSTSSFFMTLNCAITFS